jgi:FkbM family methyltransferase
MKRRLLAIGNSLIRPLGAQIYRSGMDMESMVGMTAQLAPGSGTVFDIGASNGRWSRMAMPALPGWNFIGIDPLREREPALKALQAANPRFDYILCVAGEQDSEQIELAVSDDLDGSTVGGGSGSVRQVASHSIDAIVRLKNASGPYILKFDTHGFEVPILNGARATLESTLYIVMEVYNYRHTPGTLLFHEMCAMLDGLGFRCFGLADPMRRPLDGALWQFDLFFARKDNAIFRDNVYERA